MNVIQTIYPGDFAPVHGCLNYGLTLELYSPTISGTQASFSITFSSGGTAANGTIIYIQGQKFVVDNTATVADGYSIKFDGLTDMQRATWLYNTLRATLFFDPSIVTIVQFGNVVTVTYNQVGQQSNWQFDNGSISEISFYLSNGTNREDLKSMSYIWSVYENKSALSLPDTKLVSDKILPLLLVEDRLVVPSEFNVQPQIINISDEIRDIVKTTLPSVYSPIFTAINDDYFRKLIYMRAGLRYLDSCDKIDRFFSNGNNTWVYNMLFQDIINPDVNLINDYIYGNKPLLIKNTYTLCRSSNMFVWSLCEYSSLEIVYYDASGAALESSSQFYGSEGAIPTYMNVGCFGQTIPSNCAYYVLNYMNSDGSEVLHAVRINVVSCGCIEGEFIFCTDLGGYETMLMDKAVKHEIPVASETIQGQIGCTVTSLIKGGRSIVNKETESVFTFEKWVDTDTADELEYIAQFQRSQSFYMKQFIDAADSYAYLKVIPENITFVPQEIGKRPKLTFTIRFNQQFKSHPQNEAVFI